MTGKKKITAPSKKRAAAASSSKAHKKKGGAKPAGKGKATGAAKPAKRATKPAPKQAKKSTSLRKKPTVRKVAPTKKTPAKAKVEAKTKTKEVVSQTPKAAGALGDIKRALINKREAIVKEAKEEIAKYISGENRQLVDTALDEGDWAVVDISEDINLRRLAAHRRALHDIDESLRKIGEGSYGICEECGEEIGEKRLHVLPTATLCVICQGNKERLEAIEKASPSE